RITRYPSQQRTPLSPHPSPAAIYPLSLHDALPISGQFVVDPAQIFPDEQGGIGFAFHRAEQAVDVVVLYFLRRFVLHGLLRFKVDRKSTRLNSSHVKISYAVFCLKKKTHKQESSPS